MSRKKIKTNMNKRSAFTLIEVILVVVILGIIAGVAMKGMNIGGKKDMADKMDAKATITQLSAAVDLYEVMNGTYPANLDGLLDSSKQGYPFLKTTKVPLDPWGKPYTYTVPGPQGMPYKISCTTPTGEMIPEE